MMRIMRIKMMMMRRRMMMMRAYSLSETASLSLRCSSLPSANLLLLSVASTHLPQKEIEIVLRRENWKLLATLVLFTFSLLGRPLQASPPSPTFHSDSDDRQISERKKVLNSQRSGQISRTYTLPRQIMFKSDLKPPRQKCRDPLNFLAR